MAIWRMVTGTALANVIAAEAAGARFETRENSYEKGKMEVFEVSHEGVVLGTREANYHDDSDFYAIVWNAAKGAPEEVLYATTRGWTYMNGATVDATPEVRAAYEAYKAAKEAAEYAAYVAREAALPKVGRVVTVVRGRKVPKGTTGEVVWYGAGKKFGYGPTPMRVGIRTASGEVVWTDAKNVEVTTPAARVAA